MPPSPSLKTAMTPFPFAIGPDATLTAAKAMMEEHAIHHLPVAEDHQLLGIITAHDITNHRAGRGGKDKAAKVKDAYVPEVYAVDLNEPLAEVLSTMAERHIGSAIVTRQGRISGVFTWVDACRALGAYLAEAFPQPTGNDAA